MSFVNGGTTNGGLAYNRDDDDDPASDEELERRRIAKQNAETEKQYLDAERRWLNREKSRTAALERERERDDTDASQLAKAREKMIQELKTFDDDVETSRRSRDYYADRSLWIRNRAAFRAREIAADDTDR